jgi:cytochrome b6-f complex iron-sulfur subunit
MKPSKPKIKSTAEKPGRRDFLKNVWKILGVIAALEFSFFTLNILRPLKWKNKNKDLSTLKIIGNVEDFSINSVSTDRANKVFLVRETDGGFLALSLICSHLGCSVSWDQSKNQFICPCHSSSFDRYGDVINSPAPRALDFFPIIIEKGKIKIDISQKTKRSKFEKKQLTYAV